MSLRVLHLAGWYFPDSAGGTEVYVASLMEGLRAHGVESEVGRPASEPSFDAYDHAGVTVHRYWPVERQHEGVSNGGNRAARFRQWLNERSPDIVHVHSVTAGLHLPELEVIASLGLPIVLTVHCAHWLCPRTTLLRWGREPCDGELTPGRCTECYLQWRGVPRPLGRLVGRLPTWWARRLHGLPGRLGTGASMPAIIAERRHQVERIFALSDRICVVCQWLWDVAKRNGADEAKMVLSGLATDAPRPGPARVRTTSGPIRVGYLGRYHPEKGLGTLIQAVATLPDDVAVRLVVRGPASSSAERQFRQQLNADCRSDRIELGGPVARLELAEFFRSIDLLAVPSEVLETGPLVVLEAFAHQVPVLGSDLGGIRELIEDQRAGVLVPAGDIAGWRAALTRLSHQSELAKLNTAREPLRTWDDVAREALAIYGDVRAIRMLEKAPAPVRAG